MTIELLVTPEKLEQEANDMNTNATRVQTIATDLLQKVTGSVQYWDSPAASEFRNKLNLLKTNEIDQGVVVIREYSTDLREAAAKYKSAEAKVQTAAEGLPADGIFK
jgi:WXG100 family type VII secretion target